MKKRYKTKMETVDMGILGKWTGKLNATSVFGVHWPLANRSKPKQLITPSAAQELHNMKWTLATLFASKIRDVAKIGYELDSRKKSLMGVSRLRDHLLYHAITGGKDGVTINYENVLVSLGVITPLLFVKLKLTAAGRGRLKWKNDQHQEDEVKLIRSADLIYLLIYNKTKDEVLKSGYVGQRSDELVNFELLPFEHNDELHCWAFAKSSTSKDVSDSSYIDDVAVVMP